MVLTCCIDNYITLSRYRKSRDFQGRARDFQSNRAMCSGFSASLDITGPLSCHIHRFNAIIWLWRCNSFLGSLLPVFLSRNSIPMCVLICRFIWTANCKLHCILPLSEEHLHGYLLEYGFTLHKATFLDALSLSNGFPLCWTESHCLRVCITWLFFADQVGFPSLCHNEITVVKPELQLHIVSNFDIFYVLRSSLFLLQILRMVHGRTLLWMAFGVDGLNIVLWMFVFSILMYAPLNVQIPSLQLLTGTMKTQSSKHMWPEYLGDLVCRLQIHSNCDVCYRGVVTLFYNGLLLS